VQWTAPYNGGSAITNYKLYMNAGTGSSTYTLIATLSSSTFTYT